MVAGWAVRPIIAPGGVRRRRHPRRRKPPALGRAPNLGSRRLLGLLLRLLGLLLRLLLRR